jgi:hypothetical protein
MANITDIERLNYYEGEYLGAADFEAEQEYHRDMRRRHNVGQHTWGIVNGFDLAQVPNGGKTPVTNLTEVDIYIQPGMAVDGFGREIVSLNKTQLTQDLFNAYYDPNPAAPPKPMYVWISYAQTMLQPAADACSATKQPNAFGRVQESFALTVTPTQVGPTDDLIVVDGSAMPAPIEPALLPSPPSTPPPGVIVLPYDDSVPYQEFPIYDSSVNWYIPLGRVFWDPHNTVFVQQPDSWAAAGRQYVGIVASSLQTPTSSLVIQNRFAPFPLPDDPNPFSGGVGVEIAGSLTVDRLLDATQQTLIGGRFDPANPTPLSPLTIIARGTNEELIQFRNPSGQETWLICENPGGNNPGIHFGEIAPGGTAPGTTRLFIQDGGNVGIGTLAPTKTLDVAGDVLVEGSLKVSGNQNIFGVKTFTKALSNQNIVDGFREWTVDYPGQFESVYLVLAVFQGFSIFGNDGNLKFDGKGHAPGGDFIPQHAFVRVAGWNNSTANGFCYCSKSRQDEEGDNTILFTVVVFGKPKV